MARPDGGTALCCRSFAGLCPASAARLRQPKDLTGESLIRVQHAPEDWPRWLAAIGTESPSNYGSVFEFYGQDLQAALDVRAWPWAFAPAVNDDLAAGRLVTPFEHSIHKGSPWGLVHQPSRLEDLSFQVFHAWIIQLTRGVADI
ncbi:MAG: hypothetical protein OSB69_16220 [Alphaproteobacteria bacterium]|nr:hypothetical protein [Alphaproteobacteria bacterium]